MQFYFFLVFLMLCFLLRYNLKNHIDIIVSTADSRSNHQQLSKHDNIMSSKTRVRIPVQTAESVSILGRISHTEEIGVITAIVIPRPKRGPAASGLEFRTTICATIQLTALNPKLAPITILFLVSSLIYLPPYWLTPSFRSNVFAQHLKSLRQSQRQPYAGHFQ